MIQLMIGARAGQWWYFLPLPTAAVPADLWRAEPVRACLLAAAGAVIAAMCLGYAYAINGLSERSTDLDPHKNPWIGQEVLPGARLAVAGVGVLAVGAAAAAGPLALMSAVLSVAAATVYSAGPRTKRHVVLGTLSNALIFGPLLLLAPGAVLDLQLAGWLGTFLALLLQNQLIHEQVDAHEDAAAGDHSSATWLGPAGTNWAIAGLGGLAALAALSAAKTLLVLGMLWLTVAVATAASADAAKPASRRRRWQRWSSFVGAAMAYLVHLGTL